MKVSRHSHKIVLIPEIVQENEIQQGIAAPSKKMNVDPTVVQCTLRGLTSPTTGNVLKLATEQNGNTSCLYAKRGARFSNIKFIIYDHDMTPMGQLSQVQSNLSCHAYELSLFPPTEDASSVRSSEQITVSYIVYQVPSIVSYITKVTPRRARMLLLPKPEDEHHSTTSKRDLYLRSLASTKTLPATFEECYGNNLSVFESKEPYVKPNGRFGLDFGGRGRGSSPKNMQLTWFGGSNVPCAPVLFQMVKYADDTGDQRITKCPGNRGTTSHVDFRPPFNQFQAFGMALAQIDL